MTKNQKIIIAIVLAALVAMCYWTVSTIPEQPTDTAPLDKRIMTYDGNTIVEEKDGKKLWEMTAETMEVDIDTQDAAITNMDAKFYAEDGRELHVKAPKASYKAGDKFLTVEGGLQGDSTDGLHVKSDGLEWNAKEEKMALVGNAELQRDSDALKAKGDRIESHDNFKRFKIIGHAHLEKGNN